MNKQEVLKSVKKIYDDLNNSEQLKVFVLFFPRETYCVIARGTVLERHGNNSVRVMNGDKVVGVWGECTILTPYDEHGNVLNNVF